MTYVQLDNYPDYEISTEYPHHIRKIGTTSIISNRTKSNGYMQVYLNRHPYLLHRIIAEQFIPNDDPINKTEVDHINRIKDDNHISNLRWVTRSQNQCNKTSYNGQDTNTYIPYEDVPDDIIAVTVYGKHELDHIIYSFSDDTFYFDTDEAYRVLPVRLHNDSPCVWIRDIKGNQVCICLNKFKHLYDLI